MLPQPTVYPVWATTDQVDPVSGQNNVLTPPTEKQLYGWDFQEFPPRNWFNWLGRYTYQWIAYLAQQNNLSLVVDGSGNNPAINPAVGGLIRVDIVDTGAPSNFYTGLAYFPPASASPVTINTVNSSVLTVSQIQTNGTITVSGGTGPYIVSGVTLQIP